jgi:ABC-type multidrug transport system permease subunit
MTSRSATFALVQKSLRTAVAEPFRLFEITVWPVTFFLSVTLLASFLTKDKSLIAVIVLSTFGWRAMYQFSNEICDLYRTDFWGSCLEHLLLSPVTTGDFVLAGTVIAAAKLAFSIALTLLLASVFFPLPPINAGVFLLALLMLSVFGIEVGVLFLGLNYFFDEKFFALSYAISDVLAVLSAVFYPLAFLPAWLLPVSMMLPSTHAFSLIKSSYGIEPFNPVLAVLTTVLWGVGAVVANKWLYARARKDGRLLKLK